MRVSLIAAVVACANISTQASAQVEYSADDVFKAFYSVISEAIQVNDEQYLSLSVIGSVADAADTNAINILANSCPPIERKIASPNALVRLDIIYEKALDGMIGPDRPKSEAYAKAQRFISEPSVRQAYEKAREAYLVATDAYIQEQDLKKRPLLLARMTNALDEWNLYGYKGDYDAAVLRIETEGGAFSDARIQERRRVLTAYRAARIGDTTLVAFRAPLSEVSPPVALWPKDDGWVKISFSDDQFDKYVSSTTSSKSGFGGISLGFVNVAGTSGGNKTNETRVSSVKNFNFTIELKRVSIIRNWLDPRIFTEPGAWTWKQNKNTKDFPNVSYGQDGDGTPNDAPNKIYDSSPIFCPMITQDMIIARNLSIVSTTSKSNYQLATSSGSSGGGGTAFGFLGGGSKKSWTTQTITESGNDITFRVDAPGTAVVGFVSAIVPKLPAPNPDDKWPTEAWRE